MASNELNADLLRVDDLAKIFRKSERSIQRWMKNKLLPRPLRPGGPSATAYWSRKVINDFIEAGGIEAYRRNQRK